VEYALVHARARPENAADALRAIAADWSGEVLDRGDPWSTVRVSSRTGSDVAPLLSEVLGAPVVLIDVAGPRFSVACWRPGSEPAWAEQVAAAFGKDPGELARILRSAKPPDSQHAEVAGLLGLPRPVVTGLEPVFDSREVVARSELANASARVRRRSQARRIFGGLALLEIVAFLAVDYFWFLEPSRWLVPALAVFVLNGIALIVLHLWLRRRRSPSPLRR
jgi:hypothetical protein